MPKKCQNVGKHRSENNQTAEILILVKNFLPIKEPGISSLNY